MAMDSNNFSNSFFLASFYQMSGYVCGHIGIIQELEMSPVSLLSSQAWKLLEALIDRGVWMSSEECLVFWTCYFIQMFDCLHHRPNWPLRIVCFLRAWQESSQSVQFILVSLNETIVGWKYWPSLVLHLISGRWRYHLFLLLGELKRSPVLIDRKTHLSAWWILKVP